MTLTPVPPSDLASRIIPEIVLASGAILCRFHTYGPARYSALYYSKDTSGRLNAPDGSYGTLYVAARPEGAFAETFLRSPGNTSIDRALLATKALARMRTTQDLHIADLTGNGLARIGATNAVMAAPKPYSLPQIWSKALYQHPAALDGIAYRARHDPAEICYALFDRCSAAINIKAHETSLEQPWLWDFLDYYKVGLTP